ncbi:MAG TPA: SOS response-associated peptidase family protein [Steroidobacteraceae bacterium]|nr:SOS response-associated peptidase family protein [Steroidobacteraceae bacterium]
MELGKSREGERLQRVGSRGQFPRDGVWSYSCGMCQRLVIPGREEAEQEISVSNPWWTFETRFNVAPLQSVPAARMHERESEGVVMRWGLLPASRRPDAPGEPDPTLTSTVMEESEEYRTVWLHGQRCIVPVAGFYIWQRSDSGHRQPFYVRVVNRPVFGVAALWDRFVTEKDDDVIEGCALLTVPANTLLAGIETTGAMPAILPREAYETWLGGRPAEARNLLQGYPAERMVRHAVGPHVNFPQFDDPVLIRPIRHG